MRKRSELRRQREREQEDDDDDSPKAEWTIDVPNDPVNEQVVLAAKIIMSRPERERLHKLFPAEAFYAKEHRAIDRAIREMDRKKLDYDPAVLMRLGGDDFDIRVLEAIAEARPDLPPNLNFHVDTLLWDWKRAQATQGPIASLLEAIQNPKEAPERVKAIARQVGEAFEGVTGPARYLRDPKEVVREAMARIRKRLEGEAHFPFGVDGLDFFPDGRKRLRPGAHPGHISLVTAVSGSGKSTVVCHLALGLARQRKRVLFGAWEVNAPTTLELLAVLSLKWSRSRILDGKTNRIKDDAPMTHEEVVEIEERMHKISKYVGFFDNPFRRTKSSTGRRIRNDDHLDVIEEHLIESGCDVFIADLWQRCLRDKQPSDEEEALYRQQAMAEELQVHVIMAHQQRHKDVELRQDKRPTREGIKGSGAWLEVCQQVFAPHIPAKWKRVPDDKLELFILKQRDGEWPLGIEFDWDPEYGQISGGRDIPYGFGGETSADANDVTHISVDKTKRKPRKL